MNDLWEIEGMPGTGGCCDCCGDNLCAECAQWDAEGYCKYCAMTIEELEYSLPLAVERSERKDMPCPDCKRNCIETVRYEQSIYRSDDFFNGTKKRIYEISYVRQYSRGNLFVTGRHRSFREVLIEAHKTLDRMGLK
jgi:hypothetical protein